MFRIMIFGGAISLVTGLIMALWPGKTLLFVAVLIGVWLLVIGIVRIVQAFLRKDLSRGKRVLIGVSGLLYLVVGAICLRDLFTSLTLLAVVIGLVWTVGGAAEFAAGFPKVWPTIIGLLSIAAGVILFLWPEPSLTAIATIAGIWLIAVGLIQITLALLAFRRSRAINTMSDARGASDRSSRDAATSAVGQTPPASTPSA
ncbi:MAG TPA: hypothetical protein DGT23_23450 [Micromonosporaceae bacterium]|nr:hypothetical protein [Micromonosporaceae bacterium]